MAAVRNAKVLARMEQHIIPTGHSAKTKSIPEDARPHTNATKTDTFELLVHDRFDPGQFVLQKWQTNTMDERRAVHNRYAGA